MVKYIPLANLAGRGEAEFPGSCLLQHAQVQVLSGFCCFAGPRYRWSRAVRGPWRDEGSRDVAGLAVNNKGWLSLIQPLPFCAVLLLQER